MAVFLLSLMGIPPLVGFMGKFYVFAAIIERGPVFYWYAVVAAVNAAVAAFYYARVLKTMIIDAGNEDRPAFSLPALDQLAVMPWWRPTSCPCCGGARSKAGRGSRSRSTFLRPSHAAVPRQRRPHPPGHVLCAGPLLLRRSASRPR